MITVGITGIIGSGKTTVSAALKKNGFAVIDLDGLAKKAITLKEVQEAIRRRLGNEYVKDGRVVVERLRDKVFTDKAGLEELEKIVHPKVLEAMQRGMDSAQKAGRGVVVVDGPLIYEVGLHKSLDKIVVVSAQMDTIRERLKARGVSRDDMDRRISHQIPLEEKEKMADFVIYNNGTKEELESETEDLIRRIKDWEVSVDAP